MARAPLTFAWLLALLVTTRLQRRAGHKGSRRIQRNHSTNLRRLRTEPHRVLTTSLFWLDDARWWPYVPVFAGVVAPAERRLRSWRWLLVGLSAHTIGTYVGQSYLRLLIRRGRAPQRLENARDVGVSYFVLGVAGALTGSTRRPRRTQALALLALAANTAIRPTFTEVGHLTAYIVGVAATPLTPDDAGPYPPRRLREAIRGSMGPCSGNAPSSAPEPPG
ncbi:hypothetical protein SAMN04489835_0324 [Mycolicibacterium rutilum]|uniref:Uncharacterized protein n=1 Tax=Mycolicibacterium rutilum TaxID=370526 RepID=A0A1H6INS3_MYCRU|nr:rhomboid-like protein [Mycolicibacterium rutilum]SEH48216.1 hypothetical protein SAMN04489835_0324 [Mycolicibacterium rutilum]